MNFQKLLKMKEDLKNKSYRTKDDDELLKELNALGDIISEKSDIEKFSLSMSGRKCPSCGRSY